MFQPRPISLKRISVVLLDIAAVLGAYVAAFMLRFDFALDPENLYLIFQTLPYVLAAYFTSFVSFSLYRGIYYFSSFSDLINITKAVAFGSVLCGSILLFMRQGHYPRSILLLDPILLFLGVGAIRFWIRLFKNQFQFSRTRPGPCRRVLLVGAGDLGESLLRQMLKTMEPRYEVVGFIDDDAAKWGRQIHGRTVLGGNAALKAVLERQKVDEIVIAIGSRRGEIVGGVVEALRGIEKKPEIKIAPSLEEMLQAPGQHVSLRDVNPTDLLNRGVAHLDTPKISKFIEGKKVLISGAGGTIGSELCRQVLRYAPAKLILVESHATSLFFIDAELKGRAPAATIVSILGDIRDQAMIDRVFEEHRPDVVLHAAAHKHVHQLETNVHEGVTNNILGTYYLSRAARAHGAESFVLVSTDKAVNPASVMGATKRVAEHIVKSFSSHHAPTRFIAVRFGNVLGSSGSVLEIFKQQMAKGGPLTVTHADVTRYFMTVEEAVRLILQAAAMAQGGEIFVLKMGEPVKIMDMAKNFLLLAGLEPGKDIQIEVTGLRQGEKMEEELVEDLGGAADSEHPEIMVLSSENRVLDGIDARMMEFELSSRRRDHAQLIHKLRELVPTFTPARAHLPAAEMESSER